MLDLRAIRDDPEPVRRAMAKRSAAAVETLDRALRVDEERLALLVRVEEARAEKNRLSKAIGRAKDDDERRASIESVGALSEGLDKLEAELARVTDELRAIAVLLPNPPHESVPEGASDDDNEELKRWGEPPSFTFEQRDHVELGQMLGMIDIDRGVRTSGSRFYYLTGRAVSLQFALMRYALDFTAQNGFTPVLTPVLVREEAMFGTGFLPTEERNLYVVPDEDSPLYLIGTSEVALASFHAHEVLDGAELPRRYMGYSSCFRREAGTYGKDTRGIFRVHQFDKLEMFCFTMPEESYAEHDRFLAWEEQWVQSLELPYRVVNVCTAELGGPATKKYDIEAWLPGQGQYREITSTSNTTDFQARRLDIRVKTEDGNRILHSLNGTLCAMSRTIIALLENHQRADGSVELPEVLHEYLPKRDWVLRP
jgi:seryl-tRNA synthetase